MCYSHHCTVTTLCVVGALGLKDDDWSISYQSRLGPAKWLQPSTMEVVENLAKSNKKHLVIVSPAFLADGLETLEELDIEIREHFIENGGEELTVVNCLNDSPNWIKGLNNLVQNAFSTQIPTK